MSHVCCRDWRFNESLRSLGSGDGDCFAFSVCHVRRRGNGDFIHRRWWYRESRYTRTTYRLYAKPELKEWGRRNVLQWWKWRRKVRWRGWENNTRAPETETDSGSEHMETTTMTLATPSNPTLFPIPEARTVNPILVIAHVGRFTQAIKCL